jgi:hypothetical protein
MRSAELALTLALAAPRVTSGAAIAATVTLENVGRRALWVNARLLLNSEHVPEEMREIWIAIVGPRGACEFVKKVRAGAAGAAHYRVLAPGERVVRQIELAGSFAIGEHGEYSLAAFYRDGNPDPPQPPRGMKHASALVRAAAMTLVIDDQSLGAKANLMH